MRVLALDTDVLVGWIHRESPRHQASRELIDRELAHPSARIGLTSQVVFELLHVITDPRRFDQPLTMTEANGLVAQLWSTSEVWHVPASPQLVPRTLELMRRHRLGRKRILDTALAATLELAGVSRLATWNPRDFEIFGMLELVGG